MSRSQIYLLFVLSSLLMTGCYAPVGIQSPHVVDKGRFVVNGSLHLGSYFETDLDDRDEDEARITGMGHIGLRYGLFNRVDAGVDINSAGGSLWDVKVAVLGDKYSKWSLSAGAGLHNWALIPVAGSTQWYLPLFISYQPKTDISWFISPRYMRGWKGDNDFSTIWEINTLHQGGLGFGFEKRLNAFDLIIGGQYLYSNQGLADNPYRNIWQLGFMIRTN